MLLDAVKRQMPCVQSDAFSLRTARCIFACVVSAVLLLGTLSPAAAETKRVLMLHSFGGDFNKPWSEYAKNIRTELDQQSPWPLEFGDHSLMDASNQAEAPFAEYLHTLYVNRPADLIVSLGGPAVAFVQRHRQQLFPTSPMIFTAVEQRRIRYSTLTENDTVVAVAHSFFAIFENILRVLPDTKIVAVVNGGSSPNERFWLEELKRETKQFTGRLTFIWYNEFSLEQILNHVAELPPQSAIFFHLMNIDAAGIVHDDGKVLKQIHSVANAPIFAHSDSFFGDGIVGGPMHSVIEGSRITASVAVRILGGERASDIKVLATGFATPKFDWREMRRWGISETRLMPGSEIYFREQNLWDQYWLQLLAVCAAILLQTALLAWLLYERRHRRRSQAET